MHCKLPPLWISIKLKLSLVNFMNLGGSHLPCHSDKWSSLSLLSSSYPLAFIITPFRLKCLCSLHTLAHPLLRTMASSRSFTCPLPPFDSPFLIVPFSASSVEVFLAALSDFGEGNFPQQDNVQAVSSGSSLLNVRILSFKIAL